MYSKIGTGESIMLRPWDMDDFGKTVDYYRLAEQTAALGGTRHKPRHPAESAATPVPEEALPDSDQEFFDWWTGDAVRQWPGVSSLCSSKGCTLAVFETYLTGKGAKALALGLASDLLLRQYEIWARPSFSVRS